VQAAMAFDPVPSHAYNASHQAWTLHVASPAAKKVNDHGFLND